MFVSSIPGEPLPPPPRVFYGRDRLIDDVVGLVESLTPIALIGAGGIGKTSIALTVLHNDRIKQRFGDDRRFIRCDQLSASRAHFLRRLSKVIGAGVENPEDLTPLRSFLSSKEMVIVLDNAESILDPQVANAQEIYGVVEELSDFSNICLCITSRISTIPPHCETLDIPTLSMEAACDTFYRIYKRDGRSDMANEILKQLDFHPLSITLLATVAQQNKWDTRRLAREWEGQRTGVLHAQHNKSFAATIKLSLVSPMFQDLGPDARDLLGVVAFFPQGVDENNLDWLFPTVAGRKDMFDKFCILSLAYRSDGFITMLAPLRDHLCPKDPMSVPLLCSTKDHYFSRLSVNVDPDKPGFEEARWIMSEDVNVEHLLDVFTTIDATSDGVWSACADFMKHLLWNKPRLSVLGPKIERLPDDHPFKPQCLYQLSRFFGSIGSQVERKRLLSHALKLQRERGDDYQVARTLRHLSNANRTMGLHKEGVRQAEEASEIYERLGDTVEQARCLGVLARLLHSDEQLDAAEEAASRAINLLPEKGKQYGVRCVFHHTLGEIYHSKGMPEKAIIHSEVALRIASSLDWPSQLFWIHHSLADLFSNEGRFSDAHARVDRAKPYAINDAYHLARRMNLQAMLWCKQRRFEEAKSEALRAADVFEKLGAANDVEYTRKFLQWINSLENGWSGHP